MSGGIPAPRRQSLPDMVADNLTGAIESGRYVAGEKLPTEPELARQLGVGRTSIREAIQRLRLLGLVEVRKGLGTYVIDVRRSDPILAFAAWAAEHEFEIVALFEARMTLELEATALAAARRTPAELTELKRLAREHINAEAHDSIDQLVTTDEAFHRHLVGCSDNQIIARMYDMLVPGLVQYRRMSLALPGSAKRSGADHGGIVNAVAASDPVAARAASRAHLAVLNDEFIDAAGLSRRHPRQSGGSRQ